MSLNSANSVKTFRENSIVLLVDENFWLLLLPKRGFADTTIDFRHKMNWNTYIKIYTCKIAFQFLAILNETFSQLYLNMMYMCWHWIVLYEEKTSSSDLRWSILSLRWSILSLNVILRLQSFCKWFQFIWRIIKFEWNLNAQMQRKIRTFLKSKCIVMELQGMIEFPIEAL